ncbi:MAG: glycerate kinase [Lachnospiraceae bacterium]|jgi:glycerate kinase|nr:glycerate kinase [Lachnospiraceae bacterium]
MKLILAPDSYKGTISSAKAIEILAETAEEVFGTCDIVKIPIADGGEGTVNALVAAMGGRIEIAPAHDAAGNEIDVPFGVIGQDCAVVEMALSAGLTQIPLNSRDPLLLSSYGFGETLSKVLELGYKRILIGIGGSATNDGGMGMLTALGAKFYHSGKLLSGKGEDLEAVDDVDLSGLNPKWHVAKVSVFCDVTNPLLGENGATYVYGPQKGATGETLKRLEAGMANYANIILEKTGIDIRYIKGAGAAGGVGAALGGILKAEISSGIEAMLNEIEFDKKLNGADLVITGEGRLDSQSVKYGKAPIGIAKRCATKGIPILIIAGILGEGWEDALKIQGCKVIATTDKPLTEEEIMNGASGRYKNAAKKALEEFQSSLKK